jgi:hypothetical protein
MLRNAARVSFVVGLFFLLPGLAYGQASITGVVRDSSGSVLPGVTVEASSPALIEKVRSVTTDGTGQFRIVDLRPGTYSVTFSLTGFNTVRRDGLALSGTFVATVNADLQVGALEETITVTGESPVVDVQSARQEQILDKDVIASIPSARSIQAVTAMVPGMSTRSDILASPSGGGNNIHGGRTADARTQADGLSTGYQGTGSGMYMTNVGGAQEVVVTVSGGLGETDTGGVVTNVIPREGSNSFNGAVFAAGATGAWQGSNYTTELQQQGLRAPNSLKRTWDVNPMYGGPLVRNRLWFYSTVRDVLQETYIAGTYFNKNAGNPLAWTYEPDLQRQAFQDQHYWAATIRLTLQATPRNKFNIHWDEQGRCQGCRNGSGSGPSGGAAGADRSPEASAINDSAPLRVQQFTWSSPVNNRVLLDAGFGTYFQRYTNAPRHDGTYDPALIQVLEQGGAFPNFSYRTPHVYWHDWVGTKSWRGSLSYITGAHNMRFGYLDGEHGSSKNRKTNNPEGIVQYRFNNGVPNQVTISAPITSNFVLRPFALYAQDSWTLRRLTLQGGARFDWGKVHFTGDDNIAENPQIGPSPIIPVPIIFTGDDLQGVNFKDISPRLSAAYDLFGNGKTAVKVSFGRYVEAIRGDGYQLDMNPVNRHLASASAETFATTRAWTDTNGNYVTDCDLRNPARNGECGPSADQNFGQKRFNNNFDLDVVQGWGTRPFEWNFSASVQQELLPRVAVNVAFHRRAFGNFVASDNRLVTEADFDQFSVTVADPRLPEGRSSVTGLYNVKDAKFGQIDNYVTRASNFGEQTERWSGVDVVVTARLDRVMLQGGTSTGRRLSDTCEIRAALPETAPLNPYCRVVEPFRTQMKGFAAYEIPRVAVQVSGTFQRIPYVSTGLAANFNASNALVASSLGRPLSGGAANVGVNLIAPATQFGDTLNQIDLRLAKVFRFGTHRAQLGVDLYNALNANSVLTYNQTFVPGGQWLTPQSILSARVVRLSGQWDF